MLRAYRVLAGSSRHAYHFKKSNVFLEGTSLFFCHVLKRPKDIEPDMLSNGLVYLFRALEIQMTHCSGKRGTVAEISNARAKLLPTHELCHIFARQIL